MTLSAALCQRVLSNIRHWADDTSMSDRGVQQNTVSALKAECPHYHWVGLYLMRDGALELGPYVGKPTDHTQIAVGVGVCGTAVATGQNQIIADVTQLENYLACSVETRSEIVVLIRDPADQNRILGQIDIDSDAPNAFNKDDEAFLEQVAEILARRV